MSLLLNAHDLATLQSFACHMGPVIAEQFATWQGKTLSNARRRLGQLVDSGWLLAEKHTVRDLPTLAKPLLECDPNDPEPDYGHWAYVARNRYRGSRSRRLTVYYASRKCYRAFGIAKRARVKPQHVNHDLAISECFLKLAGSDSTILGCWRHEDLFAAACGWGRRVPDVLLVDPETELPIKGLDFLGPTYSAKRLRELSREILDVRRIPLVFY